MLVGAIKIDCSVASSNKGFMITSLQLDTSLHKIMIDLSSSSGFQHHVNSLSTKAP